MLRKGSGVFLLILALALGSFWVTAYFAEAPHGAVLGAASSAPSAASSIARGRQMQILALAVAAPLALVAAILMLSRSRFAVATSLVAAAYVVVSFLLVTRSPSAIFRPDPPIAWAYCAAWVVPLVLGGVATWWMRRSSGSE